MPTEKKHHPLGVDPCDEQKHPIFNATTQKRNVVDTRTGLFEVYVPLPKITANAGRGPVVDLGLFYTPVVNNHACLGDGWSFAFSFYNEKLKRLTLSSGEVLDFDKDQSPLEVSSILVIYLSGEERIGIWLANRNSEFLEKLENTDLWVPVKFKTPEGHSLTLRWGTKRESQVTYIQLQEIKDSTRTLASIEYGDIAAANSSRTVRINFWPNDAESLTYELTQQSYALRSITAPDNTQVKLGYDDHPQCGWLLNAIETFEGVKESVTYEASQITFSDAKLTALPAVTRHTLTPLGEAAVNVVTDYAYFQADKSKPEDADWSYKAKVQQGSHVLTVYYGDDYSVIREEEQEGSCRIVTSYAMQGGESGYREIKKRYAKLARDNTETQHREETQRTEWRGGKMSARRAGNKETLYFDSCRNSRRRGNEYTDGFDEKAIQRGVISDALSAADIKGVGKLMKLDPYEEASKIPVSFLPGLKAVLTRSERISEYAHSDSDLRHITTELTRATNLQTPAMMKCTELNDWLKPKWVALCLNHSSDDEPKWITVSHTYDEEQKDAGLSYGRLIQSSQEELCTTYDYTLVGTALTLTTTQVIGTSDRVSSETCSILSGRLIAQKDMDGNISQYEYDTCGRLIKFTQCAQSTDYKQATAYAYPKPGRMETTEPNGQRCATEDDGQGNVIGEYIYDLESKEWRQMLKVEYDARGRKCKTMQFDYRADGTPMSQSCELTYDHWGQEFKQDFGGGRRAFNTYDPVTLTREEWSGSKSNTERKVTTYKEDGTVAEVKRDYTTQTFSYTHAFQVAKVTKRAFGKHEISYAYDAAGRPLTESHREEGPSFSLEYTYTYQYPQDVTIREASKISLDGRVLGERTFDAWGRVTSFSRGGVTETFTYDGAASVPNTRMAAGKTFDYTYIPELGNQVHTISSTQNGQAVSKTFTYLHGGTRDSSAREGEQLLEFKNDLNEHPTLRRSTVNKKATATERSFSPAGRLLAETDPTGKKVSYSYDNQGQRTAVEIDGQAVTKHEYNRGLLRLEKVSHGMDNLVVSHHYDESTDRETKRTFTLEGAFSLQLERKYSYAGRLRSITLSEPDRPLTPGTGQELGSHCYEYSPSGRLTGCTSTGVWQPKTPTGKPIDKQKFVHDALGNVIRCVTSFGDQQCTSTYAYDEDNGYRLTKVEHDHDDYKKKNATLTYDTAGRVTKDINGKTYSYDWLGRLIRAGKRYYTYDPADHLVSSSSAAGTAAHQVVYDGFKVRGEYPVNGTTDTRYVQPGSSACQVQVNKAGSETRTLLTLCDDDGTVLVSFDLASRVVRYHTYTAYGEHHSEEKSVLHGFNGEYRGADDDAYPLGHGYRWYSPQSMQFQSQDSQSPFDEGGPHAYGYCDGDPVNYKDPSGHGKLRRSHWDISESEPKPASLGKDGALIITSFWAGIGVLTAVMTGGSSLIIAAILVTAAVAAMATAIAAVVVAESDPKAAEILGWVSLALTVVGGVAQMGAKAVSLAAQLARSGRIVARRLANKTAFALHQVKDRIVRQTLAARGIYTPPARARHYRLGSASETLNHRTLAQPDNALWDALGAFRLGDANTVVCSVTGVLNNAGVFEDEDVAWASGNINNSTWLPWGSFNFGDFGKWFGFWGRGFMLTKIR